MRVTGVRVVLLLEEEGRLKEEMVVLDASVRPELDQSISCNIENGFFVYEHADGKREFKPTGNQTMTIVVKRNEL